MTVWEMMHTQLYVPVQTAALLLLTFQMALLLASFRDRQNSKRGVLYMMHFLFGFSLYLLILDFIWYVEHPEERSFPAFFAFLGKLPAAAIILYEGITAVILLFAFFELRRYHKNYLTSESIKETLDLLPAGIAYGKSDGTVVFSNLVMNRLSRRMTGKGLSNLMTFRETVDAERENDGENNKRWLLPDDSGVWQLAAEELDVNGEPLIQMTAVDITEQAMIAKELKDKNERLRDIRLRLDLYCKQADRIIISQELLNARMQVHNEVGNVLLECRHYMENPSSFDEEMLLQALKNVNTYLLKEYEEDDTERDPLADALEMAETIGVDVSLAGTIPGTFAKRRILASAINECASNAVKHANGDQLLVNVQEAGEEFSLVIQNNGEPPKGRIHETGGLKSLRTLVEKEQGRMQIESDPCFRLTIVFSRDRESV